MRRHRRRDVLAAVIALGLTLAACSSSSSSGTTGSSPTGTPGTKAPIVIGTIGPFSGGLGGPDGPDELIMMKGWAQSVNDAGGLDGHPIKLISMDDGPNPSAGLDDVKQLIQSDHVVAIVGDFDPSDSNWTSYTKTTDVPIVGTVTTPSYPTLFPAGANAIAAVYGSLQLAKVVGPIFGSLFCAEYTACAKGTSLYTTVANALGGIQVKVAAKVSGTQPDYTGPCQQLIDAKVNSMQIGEPAAVAQRIVDTCHSLGLHATPIQINGTISSSWLTDPAFNGMRAAESNAPFFLADTPGQQEYRTALRKYIPSLDADKDDPSPEYAWIAGKLFQAAVASAPSGPITSASITAGLYALKNETLGGLSAPLNFVKGQIAEINCYFVIGIDDGKWVAPQGNKTSCAPDAFVAPIFSVFS
jgi:branched-chain amino acid transport system substrate-binding protein